MSSGSTSVGLHMCNWSARRRSGEGLTAKKFLMFKIILDKITNFMKNPSTSEENGTKLHHNQIA